MTKIKVGITLGDINGISVEVVLKTISDDRFLELCTPIIYGSGKVISYFKNIVQTKDFNFQSIKDASQAKEAEINLVNCWHDNIKITLGKATEEAGKFAIASLNKAMDDIKSGYLQVLVTAPINKFSMQMGGFEHKGHTEYLTQKANVAESLMMMVGPNLKVALATNHLPIAEIPKKLTKELIVKKTKILSNSLFADFGINKPKIAVLGLNPHAGDQGLIGKEEQQVISPAIQELRQHGIQAYGPYPADGFFGNQSYMQFDAVLAMYHDQGLVAFKSICFENGVNFTAGLPFVRTSPDHGTAFNIAGQNKASNESFRDAIFTAIDIAKNRANFKEMTSNPLVKLNIEEIVGTEEDNPLSLSEDSFDSFIPVKASKYQKALELEAEDLEDEELGPVKNQIEEDDDEFEEDDEINHVEKPKFDFDEED